MSQDKFLIQTYVFDSSATIPEQSQLSAFWKSLPLRSITEHRMRCRLLNNVPKRRSPPKHSTPKELPGSTPNSRGDKKITPSSVTFVPAPPVAVAEAQLTRQMHLMEGKVNFFGGYAIKTSVYCGITCKRLHAIHMQFKCVTS